ncbi:MAG: hypothetical protein ACYS4W_05855 [Planctomycetota bacterium]
MEGKLDTASDEHEGQNLLQAQLHGEIPVCLAGTICRYGNTLIVIFLSVYFLLIPFGLMIYYLADPALKEDAVPRFALRVHRQLSPKYEKWARQRVASANAKHLEIENISGTEWPLFGSVFYLWAVESLQQAWENDKSLSAVAGI